jgi:delta 1-pyrroline-5-carboxylate dehydrogenase
LNSLGVNFADPAELERLKSACEAAAAAPWRATALINGRAGGGERLQLFNPADESQPIGAIVQASAADVERALGERVRCGRGLGSAQCRGARRGA